jgi:Domain of unknown function (DUF5668)
MKKNDMVGGLILIVVGLIFLAGNFDWGLDINFGRLWPLILVVLGLAKVAFPEGESRLSGMPLLLVGALFLAHNYDVVRIQQSWPVFIVAAGISILSGCWSSAPAKEQR